MRMASCTLHQLRASAPCAQREDELLALQFRIVRATRSLAEPLCPAHHVGQPLEGVEAVVGHVDDRHGSPTGVFAQQLGAGAVVGHLVLKDANADAAGVARHHPGGVLNRLAGRGGRLEAHALGHQELRVTAQLGGGALKRLPRAHRWIVEEHEEGLVSQDAGEARRVAIALHLGGQVERLVQLRLAPLLGGNEIASVEVHLTGALP